MRRPRDCSAETGCGPTEATWHSAVYGPVRLCAIHAFDAAEGGLKVTFDWMEE